MASPCVSTVFPGNVKPRLAIVPGGPGPSTGTQVIVSLDTETVYDDTHSGVPSPRLCVPTPLIFWIEPVSMPIHWSASSNAATHAPGSKRTPNEIAPWSS